MFGYYIELALASLRRNVVLTALMVAAVGVGIGASMTVLTTLVAMSGNPIPDKSGQLFVPQIDVWGARLRRGVADPDWLPTQLTYRDGMALMKAHVGVRQAAMYSLGLNVNPTTGTPFPATGRATYADFFAMFNVPFRSGAPWGEGEDQERGEVVVLSSKLANRVFGRQNAVGRSISLGGHDYRVVGVIQPWMPIPRFYDLSTAFGETEDFYLPFSTAIGQQITSHGPYNCGSEPPPGWEGRVNSDCVWLQFWVELPTAAQLRHFNTFLRNYAAEQQRSGRLAWQPWVELHDVMGWMNYKYNHLIPDGLRVNALMAGAFLIVCLVNALALMLAKFSSRAGELGLRRALGASRRDLFLQCITESLIVGLLGGVLGLALTAAGLAGLRALRSLSSQDPTLGHLYSENLQMVLITLGVSVIATGCSGLYPSLRASRIQPGRQIRA
jgi:putative ABC transport system permease protein